MKSAGVKRLSAEIAKRGFRERNRWGGASRLVKLHRPPPEMRIFSPGRAAWSPPAPAGLERAHHAGSAGAEDHDIGGFHALS